ncbi:MAG: hypothetical protein K0S65_3919 [Labilithrix sp.]|nr:hypothetical protein [Labilithrix sp.]
MLLPAECLAYTIADGRLLPSWLGDGDEPFAAAVLAGVSRLAGLQVGDAELAVSATLAKIAREAKMPLRIAEALWTIERKRWETEIDAPVDPEALRDVIFELAARLSREDAIVTSARRLGVPPEVVLGSLHADRQLRRVLVAPAENAHPRDLVARYNLALVQTLMARSMEVHATLTGDAAPIAAAAKRDGLLARFEVDGETTTLSLTGPLAIFHDTAKYGRMIARFVPALVAAPSWSLRARVVLGPTSLHLELDRAGAIAFASTVPAAPDGRLARRVARVLRAAGIRVDLCPPVVRAGATLVGPDLALEWPTGRVLVDVVPFATPEYLVSKLAAIEALDEPMLVCVDERFAVGPSDGRIVPYRGEIDAFELAAAALRALARGLSASPSSSSSSSPSSSTWPSSQRALPPPEPPEPDAASPRPFRA